jgi:hypothetical protein
VFSFEIRKKTILYLETVEDDKEEDDNTQSQALLVMKEEGDHAKYPGKAEHAEDPHIDDQIGSTAMPMLLRLDDRRDVVDAQNGEDVEDGVGEDHVEHRQAEEDDRGGPDADPTGGDAVADGEVGSDAGELDGEGDGDNAGRDAVGVDDVLGEVGPLGANLGEDGLLAEGLVDVPGHDVVAKEGGEVAVVEEDGHHLAGDALHLASLTHQEYQLNQVENVRIFTCKINFFIDIKFF